MAANGVRKLALGYAYFAPSAQHSLQWLQWFPIPLLFSLAYALRMKKNIL